MAMIDDIMAQLGQMGMNTTGGFGGLSQLGGADISQALQGQYGLDSSQLPSSMFQGISSDLIKVGLASTYTPQVEATGSSLLVCWKVLVEKKEHRPLVVLQGVDSNNNLRVALKMFMARE